MATKDDCLSLKDNQKVVVVAKFGDQFSNLNLNQNHKFFDKSLRSKIFTTDNKKVQHYDFTNDNVSLAKKDSSLWSKSKNKHLTSSFLNLNSDSGEKEELKKAKSANSSTLSLHIAAYESSVEAALDSDSCKNQDLENKSENRSFINKWKTPKHFFSGLPSTFQNPFEFPRQQGNEGNKIPENAQFKASQTLFNPNQNMSFFSNNSSTFARPTSFFSNLSSAGSTTTQQQQQPATAVNPANPMNAVEVPGAPDDTVQDLKFNPVAPNTPMFLAAGSWDNTVRIWQVNENGTVEAKAMQNIGAPVLSIDWMQDSSKVFIAGADKQARVWDLASNQIAVVGSHDQPIRTCHWIQSSNYNCLMTGSWDQTLKFWDMRQLPSQTALATINLGQKVYCADVVYPMAVVGLSNRKVKIYSLEGEPKEHTEMETPLKYQMRCCSIFKSKVTGLPAGFAQGSIEGRVAIQYIEPSSTKDNFTFKCHRSPDLVNGFQEIYPVHDVAFHPQHYTLITVGADGRYSFWDKDARTKLKSSEQHQMPITKAHVHGSGNIFAYALGYDWCRGHELYQQGQGSKIFILSCAEDLKPRKK